MDFVKTLGYQKRYQTYVRLIEVGGKSGWCYFNQWTKNTQILYLSLDESINVEPAIFYLNEGVVKEKFENGKLATTKSLSKVASAINNAVNVLKSLQ